MRKATGQSWKVLFYGTLALFAVLAIIWLVNSWLAPAKPDLAVRQSWERMQQAGRYEFSSTVEQVTFPAPALVNVGRSSTREVYYTSGVSDLHKRLMQIGIWQNDGSLLNAQDAVEVRLEADHAYGRVNNSEWQELEDFSSASFAPGQDASAFLVAAKNTRRMNTETLVLADGTERQVTRYAFNLDSRRFATYMRDQMVAELQRAGNLPMGMELSLSDSYLGMEGSGMLWADHLGLPLRLQVNMKLQPAKSGEQTEIRVTTDFFNHANENLLANQPLHGRLMGMLSLLGTRFDLGEIALMTGFSASLLALCALAAIYSRSRLAYAAVVTLVITSMLVSPLWQSVKAADFHQTMLAKQKSNAELQENAALKREQVQELLTSQWDANLNPLETADTNSPSAAEKMQVPSALSVRHAPQAAAAVEETVEDTDGDGLTDAYEAEVNAEAANLGYQVLNPNSADTDGDGLFDGEEVRLSLAPASSDTDGDGIIDLHEVTGFYYGSDYWYSNPLDKDTDKDTILDSIECNERVTSATGVCRDTDMDGIPDIFDTDDDDDGVPTAADASPYSYTVSKDVYTADKPFNLTVDNLDTGRSIFINYQLRPAVSEHLTYALNVLDWPSNDIDGQIQRISENTFATSMSAEERAADPRAANGDMRLVPMLEVTLKGSTLPLPLTDRYTFDVQEGNFKADFSLIAQSESVTRLSMNNVTGYSGSMTVILATGNCSAYTGGVTLGSMAVGSVADVETSLGVFADGGRTILVKKGDGGVLGCGTIPPVAHGYQVQRVVDDALLAKYGASARQNADGSVLVYAPLSLVHTTAGDVGVAFSSTIPFTNEDERFSESTQEVRMVWLLNMLTDICKPQPADDTSSDWCSAAQPSHWYTDLPTVVHTYNDDFKITGLTVNEERGLDMAVIFEDPRNDPEPEYNDPIWMMAKGLESSFVAGRHSSGERDITIDEIQHRFDPDFNTDIPVGDARLWGQAKNAYQVKRYQYAYADEVYKFVEDEIGPLFTEYFSGLPADKQVTDTVLLFAREDTSRQVAIDSEGVTCTSGGCSFDFTSSQVMTTAVLNWSPYQFDETAGWQPYELEKYLDLLESRLRDLDTFQPADDTGEARDVVDGQINMARLYFHGLYRGISKLVSLNGTPIVNEPDVVNDNDMLTQFYDDAGTYLVIAKITQFIAKRILTGLEVIAKMPGRVSVSTMDDVYTAFKTGDGKDGLYSGFSKMGTFSKVLISIAIAIIVVVIVGSLIWSMYSPDSAEGRIAGRVFGTGMGLITAGLLIRSAYTTYQAVKAGQFAANAASKAAVIGLVIGIAITWGVFISSWVDSGASAGSLEVNNMAADAIATTIMLVLMAMLATTGVGAIIVAVIGIIDATIMSICSAAGWNEEGANEDVQQYFCIGISGWITKVIKWTIYGVQFLINYDDADRLVFSNLEQDVTDPLKGMTTGNKMTASLKVTNNIELSDIPYDWKAAFYFWQYNDSNAKSASFAYKLQPSELSIHNGIESGSNTSLWVKNGNHKWKGDFTAATDPTGISMPTPGINRDPVIFFSEGSAVPVQECIAIPMPFSPFYGLWPICWVRTEKSSTHSSLNTSFTMDVFPDTLDEFYALTTTASGAQTLAWGQVGTTKFPAQRDADGDTLLSNATTGGNDPDDSRYDSDNDGISDAGELREGTNPLLYDTDDDGLWDVQELALGTSPLRKDTDADGLTDQEEIDGWYFTYGFNSDGSPRETMVYPDPLSADMDGDGLTDFQERLYGFHPRMISNANVLEYEISMSERDAPLIMLRLDETGSPMMFSDSSNFGFSAACETAAQCPTSTSGRYAGAALFDGGDALSLTTSAGSINFNGSQAFTLGAWVYRTGEGTVLSKWSESAGGLRLSLTGSGSIEITNSTGTASSAGTVNLDTWTHIAVSYDGSQAAFYINGTQAGANAWSNDPSFAEGISPTPLMVGAYSTTAGANGYFNGRLDEVAVYNRALSGEEINVRLVQARYNFNDNFVRPGEQIDYSSTVTNLLNSRFAYGLLTTTIDRVEAVVDWASKLLPRTFVLYPDNPVVTGVNSATLTDTLEIASDAESGQLTISQEVNAQIVDRRTESNRAELWLKFNGNAGLTTFVDSSGIMPPRDARCSASLCPTSGASGVFNEALMFGSGLNTPVNLGTLGQMSLVDHGYTISMWVKPAAATSAGTQMLLFGSDSSGLSLGLSRVDSGTVSEVGNFTPTLTVNGSTVALSTGRNLIRGFWNHIAVQYNDLTGSLRIYVNGAPSASAASVPSVLSTYETSAARIGGAPQGGNYWIDDVRIFSRPLSLLDINRLAERPVLKLYMEGNSFVDTSSYGQTVTAPSNGVPLPSHSSNAIRGSSMSPGSGSGLGYLMVQGNSLLDLRDGAFTISTWVYPNSTNSDYYWEGIWGNKEFDNAPAASDYATLERRGTSLRFGFDDGVNTAYQHSTTANVLTEDRWNHVVVTFTPTETSPVQYAYKLYVNAALKASYLFGSAPRGAPNSRPTFYVGHSSQKFTTHAWSYYMSSSDDAGSAAEPYLDVSIDGVYYDFVWGGSDGHDTYDGDTVSIGRTDTFYGKHTISYYIYEEDSTSGDDYCGGITYNWYDFPKTDSTSMSDGFNGSFSTELKRPSIYFRGSIDEMEMYRYALDSEQIYDLYNSIPIAARLTLDDRPASDTFENRASVESLDDGQCTGMSCPAAGTLGLINQAVRFDGVDDVIKVPVTTTPDYMVSLWVNSTCASCGIYSLQSGETALQQIYLYKGNICTKVGTTSLCTRGGGYADGEWHHVVYANNGTVANLWLDGQIDSALANPPRVNPVDNEQAWLGYASVDEDNNPATTSVINPTLNGQLDDVRVFLYSQAEDVVAQLNRRAPLFLAHLDEDETEISAGIRDATPRDWSLTCDLTGCPQGGTQGRLGAALQFDGQNDVVQLSQPVLSTALQSFSLSMWVMPTAKVNRPQTLWAAGVQANSSYKYSMALAPNSMKLCILNSVAATTCDEESAAELVMNNWNFVTLTVERGATGENYQLYINGYLDSTGTRTTTSDGMGKLVLGNTLAAFAGQAGGAFAGKIDEVSLYTHVLNEIDVRDAFQYQMSEVEERESLTLMIDAELPATRFISYNASFPYLAQRDIVLQVEAIDLISGIGMLEMSIAHGNDPVQWQVAPLCQDSASGTSFCPTFIPGDEEGIYKLTFRAVDRVGHQSQPDTYTLYVDGKGPRITSNIPEGSLQPALLHKEQMHTWFLALSGKMSDEEIPGLDTPLPGSGLDPTSARVTLYSEAGEIVGDGTQIPVLVRNGEEYLWSLEYMLPEKEPTGKLRMVIEASDKAGNRTTRTVNLLVDASSPSAQVHGGLPPEPNDTTLVGEDDRNPILTGGSLHGDSSDVPQDGLPYFTQNGKGADAGVEKVEAAFAPSVEASALFNEPYPSGLLAWLPLDSADVPLDDAGNPNLNAQIRRFLDISPYQTMGVCEVTRCPDVMMRAHKAGSAYFNGNLQYINLGQQVDLAQRSFTVSVWAQRDQAEHADPILWQGPVSMPDQRFLFGLNEEDRFVCGFGGTDLKTPETYPDSDWHAWACTYDLESGARSIFRDGVLVAHDMAAPVARSNENLYLGLAPVGSFKGSLDDLMIFDRTLAAGEVRTVFTGYQSVYHLAVDSDFLVDGSPVVDRSGFFHTGILHAGDRENRVVPGGAGDYALRFTGGDRLAVPSRNSLLLERGAFTQSAWIYPQGSGERDIFSERDENPEQRYPSLILTGDHRLKVGFGNGYAWLEDDSEPDVVTPGTWNHVASTFDGQVYRAYVNGVEVLSSVIFTGQIPYPADRFNLGQNFAGQIDEAMVFTRALAPLEIQAMAVQGWRQAHLFGDQTWEGSVPAGLEGPYQLHVRGWDAFGHVRADKTVRNQWGGLVDTLAPRITLEREFRDPDQEFLATYTFTIEDTMLDEATIRQNLCPAVKLEREYYNSSWFLALGNTAPNSAVYRVQGQCVGDTRTMDVTGVYACDQGGNCNAQTVPPFFENRIYLPMISAPGGSGAAPASTPPGADEALLALASTWQPLSERIALQAPGMPPAVEILKDEVGANQLRSLFHLNLQGRVSGEVGPFDVRFRVLQGGQEVASGKASVYGELWNAAWIFTPGHPPVDGLYTLEVTVTDGAGQQAQARRQISVRLKP